MKDKIKNLKKIPSDITSTIDRKLDRSLKYVHWNYVLEGVLIALGVIALIISLFYDSYVAENITLYHTPALDIFFKVISSFYFLAFVLFILTTYLMYVQKKRDGILPLWVSYFAATLVVAIIKLLVARERPIGGEDLIWFDKFSFPSMHAAVCFAVLPILDIKFPKMKIFWISLVFLVAISRIYLQMHFLSDVIAGALIGYIVGITVIMIYQKQVYKVKW